MSFLTAEFDFEPGPASTEGAHAELRASAPETLDIEVPWESIEAFLSRTSDLDEDVVISAETTDGSSIILEVHLRHVTQAADATVLTGTTQDGTAQLELLPRSTEPDHGAGAQLRARFEPRPDALPRERIGTIRLVAAVLEGAATTVSFPERGSVLHARSTAPGEAAATESELLQAMRTLARVQERCGMAFPVPAVLTHRDERALDRARRLLDGEEVSGTWQELTVGFDDVSDATDAYRSLGEHGAHLRLVNDIHVTIGGHRVNLGPAVHHFHQVLADPEPSNRASDGSHHLHGRPGPDDTFDVRLLEPDDMRPAIERRPSLFELRMNAGRWIGTDGPFILASGDAPEEVLEALRSQGVSASVWRVPSEAHADALRATDR